MNECNLYNLLGVENDANEIDIKKAYRKNVLLCHPDKNPENPQATEKFCQLTEAYLILSNEETRNDYDNFLKDNDISLKNYDLSNNYQELTEEEIQTLFKYVFSNDLVLVPDENNPERQDPYKCVKSFWHCSILIFVFIMFIIYAFIF